MGPSSCEWDTHVRWTTTQKWMTSLGSWRNSLDPEGNNLSEVLASIPSFISGPPFSFFFASSSYFWPLNVRILSGCFLVFFLYYTSCLNYVIHPHAMGCHLFITPKCVSPAYILLSSSYISQLVWYFVFDGPQASESEILEYIPPTTVPPSYSSITTCAPSHHWHFILPYHPHPIHDQL